MDWAITAHRRRAEASASAEEGASFMPRWLIPLLLLVISAPSFAQGGDYARVKGRVTDETGGSLPGVTVELLRGRQQNESITDAQGNYDFNDVAPGTYQLSIRLINFAAVNHKDLTVQPGQVVTNNEVMHLSLSAEVVVVGKRTFTNLADVENPAEDLVGIASSASQGAIPANHRAVPP